MADTEHLSLSIAESLITAMAYAGNEAAPILAVITPGHFDNLVHRDIVSRIIDYRIKFKEPPAPAHLDDIFDHILGDRDHKLYQTYNRILIGMREQARSGINVEYLVRRVVDFVRGQKLKQGLIEANERYMQGGENRDEDVEKILVDLSRQRIETMDYGERLGTDPLDFLRRKVFDEGGESVRTGIDRLDKLGIVPTRGELFYLMANRGQGKSWHLQNLERRASRQYWTCVHVTLENRTPKVKQRFIQSWLSVAKRREPYILASFSKDNKGKLDDIGYEVRDPVYAFDDPKDITEIERQVGRWKRQMDRIIVKEWPSGFLTVPMLERWLDGLEASEGVTPDMLVVDYPQLMRLDPKDVRGSFSRTTIDLRRIAGERNLALCAVMQSNRFGEKAKVLRADHTAEDISQIATADNVLTYNQSEAERRLGLARLFVAKARNDMDKFTILISQSYSVGQFSLDSVLMAGDSYVSMLDEVSASAGRENLGDGRETGYYDEDIVDDAAE